MLLRHSLGFDSLLSNNKNKWKDLEKLDVK